MYFTDQNGPKGRSHENEFWVLSNSETNVTDNKSGKSRWKKCGHLSSCYVLSWIMVLKLSKKVHFLQFCADFSNESKSAIAIYMYASERSRYALSENGTVYYAMT